MFESRTSYHPERRAIIDERASFFVASIAHQIGTLRNKLPQMDSGKAAVSITDECLALTRETCQLAATFFDGMRVVREKKEVLLAAHCFRMHRFVQAIVELVSVGHMEPACALTRTVLEAGWVLMAIQEDPGKFDTWLDQANAEARKTLKRLKGLTLEERADGMTDAAIDAAIQSVPEGRSHLLKDWALAAGSLSTYLTLYQTLSTFSHAEMQGAYAYLRWPEGSLPDVIQDPDLGYQPAECLLVCSALTLDFVRYLAGASLKGEMLSSVEALEEKLRTLHPRVYELRPSSI